jgi:hypothetical protein
VRIKAGEKLVALLPKVLHDGAVAIFESKNLMDRK